MSWNEALVDLSLFSYSPTDDRHFALPGSSPSYEHVYEGPRQPPREQQPSTLCYEEMTQQTRQAQDTQQTQRHIAQQYTRKPVPTTSARRIGENTLLPVSRNFVADESECILNRMKRRKTHESPRAPSDNIQARRGVASAPALTLSVPESNPVNETSASSMVWMPEDQIWVIVGQDAEQERYPDLDDYPTPPAYSPPRSRNYCRSAPTTRVNSQWEMQITPPMSPIQTQLQSLIQPPPEERDEERLSPLFQEAMNSVPMMDTLDPPPPPSYEGSVGSSRLHPVSMFETTPQARAASTNTPHITSQILSRNQTEKSSKSRIRAATDGSPWSRPQLFLDTSNGNSRSLKAPNLNKELPVMTRSWQGLTRRLARPKSAPDHRI